MTVRQSVLVQLRLQPKSRIKAYRTKLIEISVPFCKRFMRWESAYKQIFA